MWWLLSMATIGGQVANIKKSRIGFALWLITDIIYTVKYYSCENWPDCFLWFALAVLDVWGWTEWSKGGKAR